MTNPILRPAHPAAPLSDETTHIIAKLERMLEPIELELANGNVIEQKPALIGPIKRKDLEVLIEAAKQRKV